MTTPPRSDLTDGAGSLTEAASPGTSELTRFSPAGSAPDASAIARMANAFYASPPSNPFPGPGAALPSAPVFAAEPIYNSLPGTPALQPPLSPNLNPGLPPMPIPASGAAQPSAPGVLHRAAAWAGTVFAVAEPHCASRWQRRRRRRAAGSADADAISACAGRRRAIGAGRAARNSERRRLRHASLFAGRCDVAYSELR